MYDIENVARNISKLREKRSWTIEELAEKLGYESQLIQYWEDGSVKPDLAEVAELANLFDVTIDSLFDSTGEDLLIDEGTTIHAEDDEYEIQERKANTVKLNNIINSLSLSLEGHSSFTIRQSDDEYAYITVNGSDEFRESVYFSEDEEKLSVKVQSYKNQSSWGFNFDFSGAGKSDAVILELPNFRNDKLKAEVSGSPELYTEVAFDTVYLSVAGSGDVEIAEANNLNIEVAGAGDVEVDKTNDFVVNIAGAGDVNIENCLGNGKISIYGAGDVKLGDANMQDLDVYIAGSGEVKSDVSVEDININLVGSGYVKVREVRGVRKFTKIGSGKFVVDND